jgi:hypothetical protein
MYINAPRARVGERGFMALPIERVLRVVVWLAGSAVLGMIAIFAATGVGQDPLQYVHRPEEYAQLLLANPPVLRAVLALDNLFIVFYSTIFLLLAILLVRRGATPAVVVTATALTAAVAVLDLIENLHFMVMLVQAEQGALASAREISAQVFESLLKFHVSYLAFFVLSVALPRRTRRERLLADLGWFVQLPVGVLIYVTPATIALPLVFVRFTYFLVSLVLIRMIFGDSPHALPMVPGTDGASGSGARA